MSTTTATKNLMLDALDITKVRIHSGATTDGTQNTITLTGPQAGATAEVAATLAAASNAVRGLSATVSIDNLPAGASVSHASIWAGTTYRGSKALDATETYTAEGGTVNVATLNFTLADLA